MTTLAAAPQRAGHHRDVAYWLGLAAAPALASMAVLSALGAQGMAVCSTLSSEMPINDMALMYLIMALLHTPPWLKLSGACRGHGQTPTQIEGD